MPVEFRGFSVASFGLAPFGLSKTSGVALPGLARSVPGGDSGYSLKALPCGMPAAPAQRPHPILDRLRRDLAQIPLADADKLRFQSQTLHPKFRSLRDFGSLEWLAARYPAPALEILLARALRQKDNRVSFESQFEPENQPEVRRDGSVVSLESEIKLSSGWSYRLGFLHGNDTVAAMAPLFAALLADDEQIQTVSGLRWNGMMLSQMTLAASFEPLPKGSEKNLMSAQILTSKGRTVYVSGRANGQALDGDMVRDATPFLNQVTDDFDYARMDSADGRSFRFPLQSGALPKTGRQAHDDVAGLSSMLEVVNLAMSRMQNRYRLFKTHVTGLIAGFTNMTLPPAGYFKGRENDLRMTVLDNEAKVTANGYGLVPVRVEFLDASGKVVGGGICNYATATDEKGHWSRQIAEQLAAESLIQKTEQRIDGARNMSAESTNPTLRAERERIKKIAEMAHENEPMVDELFILAQRGGFEAQLELFALARGDYPTSHYAEERVDDLIEDFVQADAMRMMF